MHQGPTATYVQKRGGKQVRADYVGLPGDWAQAWCRSYVAPGIHAAHGGPDHFAAVVEVSLPCQHQKSLAKLGRRRYLASDLLAPDNASAVEATFNSIPAVDWGVSAHSHAAILVSHVQRQLEKLRPPKKRAAAPYRTYLQPETWQLQQQVANARRSPHRLQTRTKTQFLAVCFDAWCGRRQTHQGCFDAWWRRVDLSVAAHQAVLSRWCSELRRACKADREVSLARLTGKLTLAP